MQRSNFLFFVSIALLTISSWGAHTHREHEAHVHGSANLGIAFEALKGRIEFKAAADGVLGFEHKAKSSSDQKKLSESILMFEKNIDQMINFDPAKKCQFTKDKISMISDSEHSGHANFVASFDVLCAQSPLGSKLKLDFSVLKGLHDIDVTILIDSLQKSLELKGEPLYVELK